jgi:hypothetical protein
MSETIAIVLLILLNVTAVVATGVLTFRFGRNFIGGAIGGLLLEFVRIGVAMAITGAAEPWSPSEFTVWLINFRLFGIPILVGVGFLGGSAEYSPSAPPSTQQPNSVPSGAPGSETSKEQRDQPDK